jgi:hypothetical protein
MATTIESLIELWRQKTLAAPLPENREDALTEWVSGLRNLVLANGFTEADLNIALDDNPRTWAENEYDSRANHEAD